MTNTSVMPKKTDSGLSWQAWQAGRIIDTFGDVDEAIKAYRQYIDMITPLLKKDPSYENNLANRLNRIAILYRKKGNWDAAITAAPRLLEDSAATGEGAS